MLEICRAIISPREISKSHAIMQLNGLSVCAGHMANKEIKIWLKAVCARKTV